MGSQTFILSNIQRLITPSGRTKSGFLSDQAQLSNALLVAVTETWLSPDILDSEVTHNFPGYSLLRCDRESRQGGGVALYIREDFTGDVLYSFDNGVCELLVVMVHQLNTVVAVVYRPPNTRINEFSEMLSKLDNVLSDLPTPTPIVTLMGDFNFPKHAISWSRCDASDGSDSDIVPIVSGHRDSETAEGKQDRLQAARLCDLAVKHSLIQKVDVPTHGIEILDLIFSNDHDQVSSVSVESWPRFTDHKLVTANVSYQLGASVDTKETHLLECGRRLKMLNFNKAPWVEIQAELSELDWSEMEAAADTSPTQALNIFLEELIPLLERHVPQRKPKRKNCQRMDRRRRILWRRLAKIRGRIKSASSIHKLTKLLQDKQDLEQQLYDDYAATNLMEENQAISNIKSNPKAFFSFAKSRQKTHARIGPFLDPNTGQPNPQPEFAASVLSTQYSSVFVQPREEWKVRNPKEFYGSPVDDSCLSDIAFSEKDIQVACSELKASSAAGADGVPASLLKICNKELSKPLFILWRASLDQGCISADLLLVLISPVHKGGSRGLPKNYIPVALTSHIVKVFERVVRRALVHHLERNGLLPDGQHGFRAFRSTLTQLLSFWDTILDELESGGGVDVIYTDFSKAFDKVETGVLLHKIKESGISGKVGCWLAAFLDPCSRQQAVGVDGTVSCLSPVVSGVPQGTVLGPVLFLIHISDIAVGLSQGTTATSFADDTRVKRGVNSVQDCSDLQADLGTIYSWAAKVNMHFNSDKFECLRFWPCSGEQPSFQYRGPDDNFIGKLTSEI